MNTGVADLRTQVIESATARINDLEEENRRFRQNQVKLLVACRSLLHHCDPDKPSGDGLAKARVHAREIIRKVQEISDYY